eukprot:CAMPEP_0115312226 /NCGR_PEP_ID=MMETSP0270-20121206/75775_1 /TAXON_ID=71861 /ORGANISM="Scrippsiella trochoidea, Strain CCMP3099" /LENGTH=58 /DNA_ID=CAMNT_0002731149 /DNA_START=62 /DNA_END=235 /DNA_ORIENTATION=-
MLMHMKMLPTTEEMAYASEAVNNLGAVSVQVSETRSQCKPKLSHTKSKSMTSAKCTLS